MPRHPNLLQLWHHLMTQQFMPSLPIALKVVSVTAVSIWVSQHRDAFRDRVWRQSRGKILPLPRASGGCLPSRSSRRPPRCTPADEAPRRDGIRKFIRTFQETCRVVNKRPGRHSRTILAYPIKHVRERKARPAVDEQLLRRAALRLLFKPPCPAYIASVGCEIAKGAAQTIHRHGAPSKGGKERRAIQCKISYNVI